MTRLIRTRCDLCGHTWRVAGSPAPCPACGSLVASADYTLVTILALVAGILVLLAAMKFGLTGGG
jgi:hypothetical protein